MEFSHVKDDTVFVNGTDEERSDTLALLNQFKDSSTLENYTIYTPEILEEVKVNSSGELFAISKDHINIIFSIFCTIRGVGYEFSLSGVTTEKFLKLEESIRQIHLETFPNADGRLERE